MKNIKYKELTSTLEIFEEMADYNVKIANFSDFIKLYNIKIKFIDEVSNRSDSESLKKLNNLYKFDDFQNIEAVIKGILENKNEIIELCKKTSDKGEFIKHEIGCFCKYSKTYINFDIKFQRYNLYSQIYSQESNLLNFENVSYDEIVGLSN